jgi:hypothetical protein
MNWKNYKKKFMKEQDQSDLSEKPSKQSLSGTQTEIFRHLRPQWYNRKKHEIEPLANGGVTFLLRPVAARTYHFWIYICPEDAEFSSRQAVKTLREIASRGVVPWGIISLNEDAIVDQLTKFIITEQQALPSEVGHQVLKMVIVNSYSKWKFLNARDKYADARKHYQ